MKKLWRRGAACVAGVAVFALSEGVMGVRVMFAQETVADGRSSDRSEAVFARPVTLTLDGVPLKRAIHLLATTAGVQINYQGELLAAEQRAVTLHAVKMPLGKALEQVLIGTKILAIPSARDIVTLRIGSAAVVADTVANGIVTGIVTDATTARPIGGANVSVDGGAIAARTDERGAFRLTGLRAGAHTITVRRLGYTIRRQTVDVSAGATVNVAVALSAAATQLDQVVTTVTGPQRRVELGHVVGVIAADSLMKAAPIANMGELLTGRVPGLQVFQSQGTVGGSVRLQIRGANSPLLTNEPIVIVDGVRYASNNTGAVGIFSVEPTSRLNDLNPNDIETIEVVKGPSAATLYGTDAANGVIIVTTKRGVAGRTQWNVYANAARTEVASQDFPEVYVGWGTVFGTPDLPVCGLSYLALGLCAHQDSMTVVRNPLNNSELTLFGAKPRWNSGLNVSGGRQDLRYFLSGDFEKATGPLQLPRALVDSLRNARGTSLTSDQLNPNTLQKINFRGNLSAGLGKGPEVRISSGYTRNSARTISVGGFTSPYLIGGTGATPSGAYNASANPAQVFARNSTEQTDRFFGDGNLQWHPSEWLAARTTVGIDLANSLRNSLERAGEAPNLEPDGAVGDDRTRQSNTTADIGVTLSANRGRISSRASFGTQYVRTLTDGLSSSGRGLLPGGTSLAQASSKETYSSYTEGVTLGSYAEATVGFNERLYLIGALRTDGANSFGRDYHSAVYPKVSASWLLTREPFFPKIPGLEELRFRYAFGVSGQQPKPEWARPTFNTEPGVNNGNLISVVTLTGLGNPNIRPERAREHEFGGDLSAFDSRMRLGLTWYKRRIADQLTYAGIAPGLGAASIVNLGLTKQDGFELELSATVIDTRAVTLDLSYQSGTHTSTLLKLSDKRFASYSSDGGFVEGYALGARFQKKIVSYADANDDGILQRDEIVMSDTAVYFGQSTPPRSQTFAPVLSFAGRRFRTSALFERRSNFTQINSLRLMGCRLNNSCRDAVDLTTPLATQAEILSTTYSFPYTLIEPGDYIRLREVTAATDFPAALTRALKLRSGTVSLSARNLALWTKFSGPDPESALAVGAVGGGAEGIPQGRTWVMRLDLGF